MHRVVSLTAAALFSLSMAVNAAPKWTFDKASDIEGWTAVNQTALSVEAGVLKVAASTGADPYFFPGGEWNKVSYETFSGKAFPTLYMRLKTSPASTWQIYYITVEDTAWGEVQRQNFDVADTGGSFKDITVKMERGGWQEHNVKVFRLDPGTAAGVSAEIDYLGFEPMTTTAVQPDGKAAATWAELKGMR